MCEFETPIFIYYSHIAVIILSLITGFLILFKDKKRPTNRNAFYFILILVLWTTEDLIWWTVHNVQWNMLLGRISYMADFAVLFFLYFSYYFTSTKISLKNKILLAVPYVILAMGGYTRYAFDFFDANTCNFTSGPLIYYTFFLDVIYASLATRIFLKYYRNSIIPMINKFQIKILISAIWFFVVWNMMYEGIGKFNISIDITPHFIIGNLLFVSLIAFAIIKKDLFEFRNVFLDWFTIFLWSILFAGLFIFAANPFVMILCAVAYAALLLIFFRM